MVPNKGRGYVYYLKYHIVFCIKYRHQVLKDKIEQDLRDILSEIAETNSFQIETLEIMPDHVHILLSCTLQHYIPNLLKALKGNSARFLLKKHPELKKCLWGGHLWNPSYFVSSVGETAEDAVRRYIESQKEGDPGEDS